MIKDSDLRKQRDRFLAFAFAGADLLLEVSESGAVQSSFGATKSLTGQDDSKIIGHDFVALFDKQDQELLKNLAIKKSVGSKLGPYLVSLRPRSDGTKAYKVFISAVTMPGNTDLYVAMTKGDNLLRIMGFESEEEQKQKIASAKDFEDILQKKMSDIKAQNANANLTFLDLGNIEKQKKSMQADHWETMMGSIAQAVMAASVDGDAAAQIDSGKYVILSDENGANEQVLQQKIKDVAKAYGLEGALDVKIKEVDGDLPDLSAREATRAILHTIAQVEKGGIDKATDDLKGAFKSYLEENTKKIKTLKNLISHQKFSIFFQPILYLNDRSLAHHEVLMRFDSKESPYEMITLGEDIGMAPDIDMSVVRQALKFADQNKKKEIGTLAVNISGASIQSDVFVDHLLSTLHEYPEAASHLSFELTESTTILELDKVNNFVQKLRGEGHHVCLDDFGAGAASFQYLHKLEVDGVKIDGAYTKKILTSPRDATMIKNLTQMCHELGVYVVAEMVETEDQAKYLRDIGVDKGQGWLFGKAEPELYKGP